MKKKIVSLILTVSILLSLVPLNVLMAFAKEDILYGDADGSGRIELLDVNLMERYIEGDEEAHTSIHFTEADVNADGVIDDTDVSMVKNYLVGNLDSLTPTLYTITFVTDGGGEMEPVEAGEGYPYRGKIENPAKENYVFVEWIKDDGSTYYQQSDIITEDITLTAVYEPLETTEQILIDSFSLDNQETDVSFVINGDFGSADEVRELITVIPKDGSQTVAVDVKDNGDGTFTVYAPDGFTPGASYELSLGDGLTFEDKDEMFRKANFIIKKEEIDNIQYNPDVIFIKDTDEMKYTVGDETLDVLESALLSNDAENEAITGSFTMSGGTLESGDIVCIYENTHPNDRDYTENNYTDDAVAYIKITGVSGSTYQFESLNEDDAEDVIAMPDSIPYKVDKLPAADGSVKKSAFDVYARTLLGKAENPEFNVNDFLTFYTVDFSEVTEDTPAVYGQVTKVEGDDVYYKIINKEYVDEFMSVFINREVEIDEGLEGVDENALLAQVEQQAQQSGFASEVAEHMVNSAFETGELRQKLGRSWRKLKARSVFNRTAKCKREHNKRQTL